MVLLTFKEVNSNGATLSLRFFLIDPILLTPAQFNDMLAAHDKILGLDSLPKASAAINRLIAGLGLDGVDRSIQCTEVKDTLYDVSAVYKTGRVVG